LQDDIEALVNDKIIPRITDDPDVKFHFNDIDPSERKDDVDEIIKLKAAGIINAEYSRESLDIPEAAGENAQVAAPPGFGGPSNPEGKAPEIKPPEKKGAGPPTEKDEVNPEERKGDVCIYCDRPATGLRYNKKTDNSETVCDNHKEGRKRGRPHK
jgi:hypothetical protein